MPHSLFCDPVGNLLHEWKSPIVMFKPRFWQPRLIDLSELKICRVCFRILKWIRDSKPGGWWRPQQLVIFRVPYNLSLPIWHWSPVLNHSLEIYRESPTNDHWLEHFFEAWGFVLGILGLKHAAGEAVIPFELDFIVWVIWWVIHPVLIQ